MKLCNYFLYGVVRNSIIETAKKFPGLGLIISTRKTGYQWHFPGFNHLEINPFSESAIKEWTCQRLYGNKDKNWDIFFSHLQGQSELIQLIKNPLLLTMAVYLYKRTSILPQNKAALIGKFIEAVVDLWDFVRGVTRNTEIWTSPSYKFSSLCRTAYSLKKSGKKSFSLNEFLEWEVEYFDKNTATNMLNILIRHTGLLQKNTNDHNERWSFLNESISDYLTTRYLIERTDDNGKFLNAQLNDENWQNIWLLACGSAQDSTHLIKLVLYHEDLDEASKSTLLAKVFSQNISADHKIIETSCQHIVNSLEKEIKSFGCVSNELKVWYQ